MDRFAQLDITEADGSARRIAVGNTATIGRDNDNDIVLASITVSRCHAMLLHKAGQLLLLDLESTNGTLVNGVAARPDAPIQLTDGDNIQFGQVVVRYRARNLPPVHGDTDQTIMQNDKREKRHGIFRLADPLRAAPDITVDHLIARALVAQRQIERWTEAQVDQLLLVLAQTIADHAEDLAVATVHETEMGNVRDKTFKNQIASLGTYERLIGQIGHGVIGFDPQRQITEIASPVGIVVGLVPATHPVATFIFKTLIAIKGRNALVLSPSRRAQRVSNQAGALIQQALRQHGAPADLVQWVQSGSSRESTAALMRHPQVGLVLATGGAAMVTAAYRSGTPAIGVGPGNAPVLIAADADVAHVARSVVISKPFDNGLICGAENSLVVVTSVRAGLVAELERHGAAVLSSAEAARLLRATVDPQSQRLVSHAIGQSAATLAAWARIQRPFAIQLLVVPTASVAAENYLAAEKLAPLIGLFTVSDAEEGLKICRALLEIEGAGHTAIIHTQDTDLIERFAADMPASRILVNSPGTQGVLGLTTGLELSMTLGCGTWGGTSTTESITYRHLLNIKRIAYSIEQGASS